MSTPSFEKVHYELRPAKQVERRMFLHAFQKLMGMGFHINDYHYTGLGSIYFIDYILFHKYLGIESLKSVENKRSAANRVRFNKPFDLIDVQIGDIADEISNLSQDRKHILWLDYDTILDRSILDAICLSMIKLPAGSIFLLTVDVEPGDVGPKAWKAHFEEQAEQYLWAGRKITEFAKPKLTGVNISVIENAIRSGIVGRANVMFQPLFNFVYADGHRMLTLGGMICDQTNRRQISAFNKTVLPFIRNNFRDKPFEINVPLITRKERLFLDSAMPCEASWRPSEFEMKSKDIKSYKDIYRYYPSYSEALL